MHIKWMNEWITLNIHVVHKSNYQTIEKILTLATFNKSFAVEKKTN